VAEVVSARLGEDLLARLDDVRGDASRGAWLTDLVTRDLTSAAPGDCPVPMAGRLTGPLPPETWADTNGGVHGRLCMAPGCHARDAASYGGPPYGTAGCVSPGGVPLCPEHWALVTGSEWARPHTGLPKH
jgi:hypothetical protein